MAIHATASEVECSTSASVGRYIRYMYLYMDSYPMDPVEIRFNTLCTCVEPALLNTYIMPEISTCIWHLLNATVSGM